MNVRRCAGSVLAVLTLGLTASACGAPAAHGGGPAAAAGGAAAGAGAGGGAPAPAQGGGVAAPTPRAPASVPSGGGAPAPGGAAPPAQPGATPLQYAPGTTPAAATAMLGATCVRPGGTQHLTVTTNPGFEVAFDVQYSDGSDGSKHGGSGQGAVPPSGQFATSWVVATNAPLGTAVCDVSVAGGNESAFRQESFTVSESC